MKCCYSKLIGYTRGAVTIKGAVIYQSLRYFKMVISVRSAGVRGVAAFAQVC